MNYQEAVKKLKTDQALKNPNNYLRIEMSYGFHIVLPYKEGVSFIECLNHAQEYEKNYSTGPVISPIKQDNFKINMMSGEDYRDIKIANLMGVAVEDLKTLAPSTEIVSS